MALAGVGNFLKSTVIYCLTGVTTIFVGILGIQRVVASASDTVAAKAVKFTVGSVIPVVGGIVKDAFDTVAGGIGMIKSVTGAIGIAAILFTLAPRRSHPSRRQEGSPAFSVRCRSSGTVCLR